MRIGRIHLNNLRNDGHFQFHTEFRNLVVRSIPENLKIAPEFEAYWALYGREDEALKKIKKSAFTEQIANADRARDEIWQGLTEMNSAALKHFNPSIQEAAKRLQIVFDTYGNVARKPLNEQTSAVYNILQEFEGNYAADVAAVGISRWVEELKFRNIDFSRLMRERFDETAAKTNIILKEARAELDDSYRIIAERINALIIVEGAAAYEQFVKTLNAVIAKYMAAMRHPAKCLHGQGGDSGEAEESTEPVG